MTTKNSDFHTRSLEKVKKLWHLYILGEDPVQLEAEFNEMPDDLLMIGTGMQEFYQTKKAFLEGMSVAQLESLDIQFELHDEWYEVQAISDTLCVIYGSIWAREKSQPGQTALIDMQGCRFSIVCKDSEEGVQLISIHHSMPYVDQGLDEYYPKSLSNLARELEEKSKLDRMTEFYSRYYMEQYVSDAIQASDGYFIAMDLDNFKNVNDTKGHLVGDHVIREFAIALKKVASPNSLIGRMGGDEFAVWDTDIQTKEEIELRFAELVAACESLTVQFDIPVSCSMGVLFVHKGTEEFTSLYHKADKALYKAKALGKKCLFWSVE